MKFPRWFSPYSPPYRPSKPKSPAKEIEVLEETGRLAVWGGDCRFAASDVIKKIEEAGADQVVVELEADGTFLVFGKKSLKPNPYLKNEMVWHKKNLAQYEKDLAEYEQRQEEWSRFKEAWDQQQAEKKKAQELKELKRLQKKYGEESAS